MKNCHTSTIVITMITARRYTVRIRSDARNGAVYQYTVSVQDRLGSDEFIIEICNDFRCAFREAREFVHVSEQRGFASALKLIVGDDYGEFKL